MGKARSPARKPRPRGEGSAERRSGEGAGSALREMLRRQAQNPRPGAEPPRAQEPAPKVRAERPRRG